MGINGGKYKRGGEKRIKHTPPPFVLKHKGKFKSFVFIMNLKSVPPLNNMDGLNSRLRLAEICRRAGICPSRLSQCRRNLQGKQISEGELKALAGQMRKLAEELNEAAKKVEGGES